MRRSLRSTAISIFFFVGRVWFFAFVATHVVLHRVSIRTSCEPSWLRAGWGPVGEVDAASFRPAFEGQIRHAVIGTRVGHNKRRSRLYSSCSSVERNVLFLGDPDAVKQHGKFSGNRDDGTIACLLASTRGQVQAHCRKLESFPWRPS